MNTRYTGDEDATPEEREAAFDAYQDRLLDEQKESKAEEASCPMVTALKGLNAELRGAIDAETMLGHELDKVLAVVGNVDNRRAKFPTRLKDGEQP